MLPRKFNVVTDAQFGSTGKGAVATSLAHRYRPNIISTTNFPNAGHTAVNSDGTKHVAKALPSPAILHAWFPEYSPTIVVGGTAAFNVAQLFKEWEVCGRPNLLIHPRAGVITDEHVRAERENADGPKHIGSTLQGCGTFLSEKIMRKRGLMLARDYAELRDFTCSSTDVHPLHVHLLQRLHTDMILHEGAQGFSLDITHGSGYPDCTSRGTTAIQNLADMGLPATALGDVYIVIRPYPIRVGHIVEDGVVVGHSGGCYPDNHEITWKDVAEACGAPPEIALSELTTVTKRTRRVMTFSAQQVREAAAVNGATAIALNFANYIDWRCYGKSDSDDLPISVFDFIKLVEDHTGVPVKMVGTGPQLNHMIYL